MTHAGKSAYPVAVPKKHQTSMIQHLLPASGTTTKDTMAELKAVKARHHGLGHDGVFPQATRLSVCASVPSPC